MNYNPDRVILLRQVERMTQKKLAEKTGIAQGTLSKLQNRQIADLGSDLIIGPTNPRFEENGVTSKTHCDAMTHGLFRASDIVY